MCAPVGSHVFPHRDLHGGTRESCEGRRTNRCCRSAGEGGGMGRGVPRVREEASLDRGRPTTRNGCGSAYPPVGGPDVLHPSCEHGVKGRAGGGRCRESSLFCVDCAGAHHACCAIVAGKGEGSCPASGNGGGLPRRFVRPCDVPASSATTGIRWGHRCEGNGAQPWWTVHGRGSRVRQNIEMCTWSKWFSVRLPRSAIGRQSVSPRRTSQICCR